MLKTRSSQGIKCHNCAVRHLCIGHGLEPDDLDILNNLITTVSYITKKEHICFANNIIKNLYAMRLGSCKEYWLDENGNENVTTFYFPGDIIGMESIAGRKHIYSVTALEDSELCIIPIEVFLKTMSQHLPIMERFINITSLKMQNDQSMHAKINADQQVCDFLLNIIKRMSERNPSAKEIYLTMSQVDISNFLGVAYETVNRVFKNLNQKGIIKMKNKTLKYVDIAELEKIGRPNYSLNCAKAYNI